MQLILGLELSPRLLQSGGELFCFLLVLHVAEELLDAAVGDVVVFGGAFLLAPLHLNFIIDAGGEGSDAGHLRPGSGH